MEIKLNLGSGFLLLDGFINCDFYNDKADIKCDVRNLPFYDNKVDEIYSSHVIEHFDYMEGPNVLKEWFRVLKPNGKLVVETPDLVATCKAIVDSPEENRHLYYAQLFGVAWMPGCEDAGGHKFVYTEQQLGATLLNIGFKNIIRVSAQRFEGSESLNLKLECIK